jgi:hypothetical protein
MGKQAAELKGLARSARRALSIVLFSQDSLQVIQCQQVQIEAWLHKLSMARFGGGRKKAIRTGTATSDLSPSMSANRFQCQDPTIEMIPE